MKSYCLIHQHNCPQSTRVDNNATAPPRLSAHANQPRAELVTDPDRAIPAPWAPFENKFAAQAQVMVLIGTELLGAMNLERLHFYLHVFTVLLYFPTFDHFDFLSLKMVLDYFFSFQTGFLSEIGF